ncbi:MAG TPA: hypothetical protein VMT60_01960 [Candidatus Bathyarchaeia archaeon]|nr:hypothetical protein [Candidatus Bathyarchaeia archaeon]
MKLRYWLIPAVLAFVFSCSSDPEGPVSAPFVDGGTYGVRAGETHRVAIPLNAVFVDVPRGDGISSLLALGRTKGIEYRAILVRFDFTLPSGDAGKRISSARLHLPILTATPDALTLPVTFNELRASFADSDTIVTVPPYDPRPIADSLGQTLDTLSIGKTEYDLDTTVVNGWISGRRPHYGIAIVPENSFWAAAADTESTIEMNAREAGADPPSVRVTFTDGTSATFGPLADYAVALFKQPGLNCLGGIARRIFLTYDVSAIPKRAMVNASFVVLRVRGGDGLGATNGEKLIGQSPLFLYYLYAPNSADTLSADWRLGTGVDRSSFDPIVSAIIKMPLRGYLADVLRGARINNGLVLQSDQEVRLVQRASFTASGADAPYIELIYTLPADFGGGR